MLPLKDRLKQATYKKEASEKAEELAEEMEPLRCLEGVASTPPSKHPSSSEEGAPSEGESHAEGVVGRSPASTSDYFDESDVYNEEMNKAKK